MKHFPYFIKAFVLAISCLMLCLLYISCATQATLTGGEKDVSPPKILKTLPQNYTKNFKERQLKIRFNEYIALSSPTENIIINPTTLEAPKYEIQGKSLVISFKDDLDSNTTYSVLFLEAIKDITEANVLYTESIVFSTGASLDSCMLHGNIRDAYTLEPSNKIAVILYETDNDSAPYTQQPLFYTYTDKKGDFTFYNLPQKSYKLFALEDKNQNKLFDLPDEMIAFSDTLLSTFPIPKTIRDSIEVIDNEKIDSTKIQLYLFKEQDTTLKYLRRTLVKEGYYQFVFTGEVHDFLLNPVNNNYQDLYVWESNRTKDTIGVFFIQLLNEDIDFVIEANGQVFDTVTLNPASKVMGFQFRKSAKDSTEEKKNTFNPQVHYAGEIQKKLTLEFAYPVKEISNNNFLLLELKKEKRKLSLKDSLGNDTIVEVDDYDTLMPNYYFLDSLHRKWIIDYEWKYNKNYVFLCQDSVFYSYLETFNDTISVDFKMKTPHDYGEIQMEYQISHPNQYIIQLLTDKGEVVAEQIIQESDTINYPYLQAGKYKIRVIVDVNKNSKWDTGKYSENRQAEPIIYYSKVLEVRNKWTLQEIFLINE
ncbi:MAG: Ig-like domain-containing protein [Bacteroidales bacterium]|nr:Ig-like domain-containing protein [Bacteroidales bacterium]